MIGKSRILGLIPARGGSKGIPRKNVRLLAGKPLITWTIDVAKMSKYIDRLVVTSDDDEIAHTASQAGAEVPFMRPAELATDTASTMDAVLHAFDHLPDVDVVVVLQPTSPFRNVEDIDRPIELWQESRHVVVGVVESKKSPLWMYDRREDGTLAPLIDRTTVPTNRQALPKTYVLNGAVYVASRKQLTENPSFLQDPLVPYIMPDDRSLDIDSELDWRIAECLRESE